MSRDGPYTLTNIFNDLDEPTRAFIRVFVVLDQKELMFSILGLDDEAEFVAEPFYFSEEGDIYLTPEALSSLNNGENMDLMGAAITSAVAMLLAELAFQEIFDSDQEIVTPAVEAFSREVAEYIAETGDRVLLIGHTDSDGEPDYNLDLGMKRAEEYKEHLVSLGVDESKIEVKSVGETDPAVPNDSPENKQRNRRVTIQIIK